MIHVVTVLLFVLALSPPAQSAAPRGTVIFADGTAVSVEIAASEAVRQKGLMFRTSLSTREGMLFIFDTPDFYPFWMQNCVIPLDIIWIDAAGRITSIAENVPPCRKPGCDPPCAASDCPTYAPRAGTTAKYVVEVQAGFATRHQVAAGQTVKLQMPPS